MTLNRFRLAAILGAVLVSCPGLMAPSAVWADPPSPAPPQIAHTLPPAQPFTQVTVAPYTDPHAVGTLGFCDKAGHPMDHGSIDDKPFAAIIVSSLATPSAYAVPQVTAQLNGVQPLPGVEPGAWQGELMTAPSRFTDPAHPMAAGTARDLSLRDFMGDYSAGYNGFVQLRLYLAAPGQPATQAQYAAADVQITLKDTWNLVRGGNVACTTGAVVSTEDLPAPAGPTTTARPADAPRGNPVNARSASGPSKGGSFASVLVPILLVVSLVILLLLRRRNSRA